MLDNPTLQIDTVLTMGSMCCFDPSSTPRTLASWHPRHDKPSSDRLVSPTCRVVSSLFPFNTPHSPCRDPRRDVENVVSDAFVGDVGDLRCWTSISEMKGVYFEHACERTFHPKQFVHIWSGKTICPRTKT